ncbi:MAG: ribosome small subunit-dependent GTPase A, partial [Alphaproteobacteria bacterium]|nr:ribosome small subunit-dependent GTPase A [Alphaproteobacteria bacterium]
IKQISNDYVVESKGIEYDCKARGKFRKMEVSPLVGDEVEFDEKQKYILKIYPRKNELNRPRIANVDQAIIIASLKQPDFDTNLLDKLLCIITYNNIEPIIIFTKSDLLTKDELDKFRTYFDYYKSIGYDCYMNYELDKIIKIFKNKVSVFTGQSGAGKSTLLNNLDKTLNIETGEISKALNRGKHTTRHTALLEVGEGLVADTPGFSSLSFGEMTNDLIRDNFTEFNKYRYGCKYKDCMHNKEDECEIKNKVNEKIILKSRYDNYINFITKG